MLTDIPVRLSNTKVLLLAIACLGLILRIHDLGGESLWNDEAGSVRLSHMSCSAIIKNRAHDVHPPLYFLLLRYWVRLFGDSEVAVRSLSVLFGVLAIGVIYGVGRRIFDEEAGLWASLLLALSTFHVRYAQEARAYALMSLLTLLSFFFLLRWFQGDHGWESVGYAGSTALLLYTHYFGFFVVLAQNLYSFTVVPSSPAGSDRTSHIKRWVLLQALVALLYAPWIRVLIKQVARVQGKGAFSSRGSFSLHTFYETLGRYTENDFLTALFLLLAAAALFRYTRPQTVAPSNKYCTPFLSLGKGIALTDWRGAYLLLLWLFVPILLPLLASGFSPRIYSHRYTISASLALYLLAAKGIRNLPWTPAKWIVTGTIIVVSLINVWGYYGKVQKEQWREVASLVDRRAEPGDLVLFNAFFCIKAFDYYSKRSDLIKKPFPAKTNVVDGENIKELGATVRGHHRVWFVRSHSDDKLGLIPEALSKEYTSPLSEEFRGIHLFLFEGPRDGHSPSGKTDD